MVQQHWRATAMRIYVWDRCLLLQAGTFIVDRRERPYKRLSATIIVANGRPFVLEVDDRPAREYQGVLIAPNVARQYIEAVDSDLTFLDAGITSAAYRDLEPHLVKGGVRPLIDDELRRVQSSLGPSFGLQMDCAQAIRLFDEVVHSLCSAHGRTIEHDPRVRRVMELVEQLPFDALSVAMLARDVGLSESRLRDLFGKAMGCRLSQYMRWIAAWKAVSLWQEGMKFTDVALAAGFHDLAHADHAFAEIFGLSPSEITDTRWMSFHKCGP